jgi:hypothetical protein
VCQAGGKFELEHPLYRDYLRAHSDERDAHATMKRLAAQKWSEDRIGYTYAKSSFILEPHELPMEWGGSPNGAWTHRAATNRAVQFDTWTSYIVGFGPGVRPVT